VEEKRASPEHRFTS